LPEKQGLSAPGGSLRSTAAVRCPFGSAAARPLGSRLARVRRIVHTGCIYTAEVASSPLPARMRPLTVTDGERSRSAGVHRHAGPGPGVVGQPIAESEGSADSGATVGTLKKAAGRR
jgi:hypothetical protein